MSKHWATAFNPGLCMRTCVLTTTTALSLRLANLLSGTGPKGRMCVPNGLPTLSLFHPACDGLITI